MNRIFERVTLVCTLAALAISASAEAADADRAQRWEATLQSRYTGSETVKFDNGATADVNGSTGFGFGFAYNFDNKRAAGIDFAWNSLNYAGTATQTGGATATVSATAYTSSALLNGTYHFIDGPFTPYVSGILGFTYTDTGIPAGVTTGCWWYPWYGYICGPVTYSRTSTDFTYGVGAGLRWDVTPGFFLKGGVQQQWITMGAASGTPTFTMGRFDIGFKF
jgi:hypothetical protein